jgi:hypothetical protein
MAPRRHGVLIAAAWDGAAAAWGVDRGDVGWRRGGVGWRQLALGATSAVGGGADS